MKKILSIVLSLSLVITGLAFSASKNVKADDPNILGSHDRSSYTWMTSNANNGNEGFCGIGSGFSAINAVNENLSNGNNMLGTTASTDEVAIYVNLGNNYDISSMALFQGSTNNNYNNSYCKKFSFYYSGEIVNSTNKGAITWTKAGECTTGTIYSTAKQKNAADVSSTGDTITFDTSHNARSVKVVFDKDSCMGTGTDGNNTGTTGTVSILSLRVYGTEHQDVTEAQTETQTQTQAPTTTQAPTEAPTSEVETIINSDGDDTMYGSFTTNLTKSGYGYASSNDRGNNNNGTKVPLKVSYLTDHNEGTYIVTDEDDLSPWFAVDLRSVQDVNKVRVVPGASSGSKYTDSYPISYEIQVASENIQVGESQVASIADFHWTTVKTITNGSLAPNEITFPHQNTRWLRIKVNTYNSDYCSLLELGVYGTDKSTPYVEPAETTDILFIGNSMTYYNTLCDVVEGIANMQGKNLNCTAATNGGKNLIYQSTASNVDTAIKVGGYEYVVIQDIVGSFDAENLKTGAETLITKIKQYNPDAQIIFYEPWPVKGSLTGENTLLPYFTNSYFKTARNKGAALAPAGEAFYELYTENNLDYYCSDEKHPKVLGTFVSASTILYTMFPELAKVTYTSADQNTLDTIINDAVSVAQASSIPVEGRSDSYDLATLNLINSAGYKYAHAVSTAMASNSSYTSVAGEYVDLEDQFNPDGLPAVSGNEVDASLFTEANGDIAIGKTGYSSSINGANNAVAGNDEKTGTRWESEHGVDPQWYYIDLGQATKFNTVGFIWEGAYAKKYVIQVSDDAQNWTTVKYVTATSAKTVQIDLGQRYNKRYIRMVGFERGLNYGYSFYEMGVWNATSGTHSVEIDGTDVETVSDGDDFTIPSTYELGYMDANDNSKVYKPGTKVSVDDDLSLVAIKSASVVSGRNGASIRLVKSNPGLAFESQFKVNDSSPIVSSAFTYGVLLTTSDIYDEFFDGDLTLADDSSKAANIVIGANDFFDAEEGIVKAGVMKISTANLNRDFLTRAYMSINYTDGTSRVIYSELPSQVRSIAGISKIITSPEQSAYYNSLSASEKEAASHFAEYAN